MADAEGAQDQLADLAAKHKLQKKELQGKTLSMKKSISKTDKKKKKELNEQIEKLEKELHDKQDEEMSTLKESLIIDGGITAASVTAEDEAAAADEADAADEVAGQLNGMHVSEARPARVSKAQRRRDKKQEQARDRQQRIEEQERLNLDGARHLETEAIRAKLRMRGRAIHEVPSDGDCMYAAIHRQLAGSGGGGDCSVSALRRRAAAELLRGVNEYRPFVTDPATGEMYSEDGYRHYCRLVADTPAWGGHAELAALAASLQRRIEVVQAAGAPVLLGDTSLPGEPLLITFHRHMYGLGEHYNATRAALAQEEDGEDERAPTR